MNPAVNLNPICKSIWLGTACQVKNCPKAHPPRCKNPDCLIRDEGLPRWKVLQCRSWHGQPKSIRKDFKYSSRISPQTLKSTKMQNWPRPGNKPISFYQKPTVPIWLSSSPTNVQNQGFNPNPYPRQINYGTKSTNNFLGNNSATWSTPLPRCSNSTWGNNQIGEKMSLAMELIQLIKSI